MRLVKVHVKDYHSVRDSNEFDIGDVTCLVGKNEAGKTALLQAMYHLRPIIDADVGYSITDDYPRRDVSDYRHETESGERDHSVVARLVFELEAEDLESVAAVFGKDALKSNSLSIEKKYEQSNITFGLDVDEVGALRSLLGRFSVQGESRQQFLECKTPEEAKAIADSIEQTEAVVSMQEWIGKIIAAKSVSLYIYNKILQDRVPKFLYFDDYYQMLGCDNIEALKSRVDSGKLNKSDHPLLGLIHRARLDLDELLSPSTTRDLKNTLEGAGNHLTKNIVKYWSQNKHLQMRFDVRPARKQDPEGMQSGTNIWAEIYDKRHLVTTELGSRSKGFVWFFSFLAWYGDIQRDKQNVILLLDEPGLSLHGKAQSDLLRYFEEELVGNHQLIYTTHSPFLVDATRFDRVRIVQDRSVDSDEELPLEEDGTKVITEVLEATDDSLFPLQGALGYDLAQTLFVGSNCLIVEGVSDLLYLQVMSGVLQSEGRESLSEDWVITPVGGLDKVPTFVALLGSQRKLNIAALIDFQEKDRQTIENMWKKKLIQKKQVLTYADFVDGNEADVEDLFGTAFYLKLVNAEYGESLKAKDFGSQHPRMVCRLEDYLKDNPLKGVSGFNHYRPARYLAEHVSDLKPTKAIVDRFEKVFQSLNELLG
tara:strand:+ start:305 stop:2257 length:1953 start_codon:yes stop_codon:yes gene_type:complete